MLLAWDFLAGPLPPIRYAPQVLLVAHDGCIIGIRSFDCRTQRWSVVSQDRSTRPQNTSISESALFLVNLVGVVHHPLTCFDAVLAVDDEKLLLLDVFPLCRFLIELDWHHAQRLPRAFVGHVQEQVYELLDNSILLGSNVKSG